MNRLVLAFAAIPALVIAHSFAEGVAGYLNGTATLRGAGYPGPEYHNLDPEYRVYRRTSGCLVTGTEILTHIPNNVAIALLTKVFGPMRGTFDGPYPSRAEAKTALQGARDLVDEQALISVRMEMESSMSGRVPESAARDCLAFATRFPPMEGRPRVRCTTFRERTVLLGDEERAVLVDSRTGAMYARYFLR